MSDERREDERGDDPTKTWWDDPPSVRRGRGEKLPDEPHESRRYREDEEPTDG